MRPINLLPPDVARQRSRRRRALGLIALALLYVALLGVGVVYWNGRVSDAQADVERQEEVNAALRREVAALADAELLKLEFDAKALLVQEALATDVDWGIVLNDLSRLLPPRVWIEQFSGTVAPTEAGALGQVSISGVGIEFPDISAWVRALDSEDFVGITGTWVNTAAEGAIGEVEVVTFNSTAVLTQAAATDRAAELIPEVP